MPLDTTTHYTPPFYLKNPHLETILPYLMRRPGQINFDRRRVETPDGDFLDLDWSQKGHRRLLVLCHGLEGSSNSQYMLGMTKAANARKMDVLCINFRSCSGEMNRKLRMYHHGEIEDLTFVLDSIIKENQYQDINLAGFSLGGNVIIKYLGLNGGNVPLSIRSAVVMSVPCDLATSSKALDQRQNYLYTRRFMGSLKNKFDYKSKQFPGTIDMTLYDRIRTWEQYDNTYTTVVTGFKDAAEYYEQGSAKNYISGVRTNTLIINALNDPFLTETSYPYDLCKEHSFVTLATPKYGGHVGFWHPGMQESYLETRALQFIEQNI